MNHTHDSIDIDYMINVMTAFKDGAAIEVANPHDQDREWNTIECPVWDWGRCIYRIKPRTYTQAEVDELKDAHKIMLDACNEKIARQDAEIEELKAKLNNSTRWVNHDPEKCGRPDDVIDQSVLVELRSGEVIYKKNSNELFWGNAPAYISRIVRYMVIK